MRGDIEGLLRLELTGHKSRQDNAVADGFDVDLRARN